MNFDKLATLILTLFASPRDTWGTCRCQKSKVGHPGVRTTDWAPNPHPDADSNELYPENSLSER